MAGRPKKTWADRDNEPGLEDLIADPSVPIDEILDDSHKRRLYKMHRAGLFPPEVTDPVGYIRAWLESERAKVLASLEDPVAAELAYEPDEEAEDD